MIHVHTIENIDDKFFLVSFKSETESEVEGCRNVVEGRVRIHASAQDSYATISEKAVQQVRATLSKI